MLLVNYISLYRKYRPLKFSEVIGQDISIRILTNSILRGEIFHAYIFNGTRGTGKTTVARILARALNCLNLNGFEPCNECYNCKAIMNSSFPDVIEIDAASNRGINEIREIRDNVKLSPLKGRYKVYIIDEVHMLTIEAFNALLKTLEEPPKNVVFILATTDIHKVPITILSRCQQIEFKRVDYILIFNHLKNICQKENIIIDDDALIYIAKLAKGSVRDSISILEQIKNISEHITLNDIFKVFSIYSFELIKNYIYYVLLSDFKEVVNIINLIRLNAVNIYNFLYNLNMELKEIIYYYFNPDIIQENLTQEQIKFYKFIINNFDIKLVYELLKSLNSVLNFYKNENDYYLFEIQTISFIFSLNKYMRDSRDKVEGMKLESIKAEVMKSEGIKLEDIKTEGIKSVASGCIRAESIDQIDNKVINFNQEKMVNEVNSNVDELVRDIRSIISSHINEDNLNVKNEKNVNNLNIEKNESIEKIESYESNDLDVNKVDIKNNILNLISDKHLYNAIKAADKVILNNDTLIFYYDSSKKINQTYKYLIKISKEKIRNYLRSKYNINDIIFEEEIKKKTLI